MQWADYRGGRPSGAALRAAGFSGVIRYIGLGSAGKRIIGPEYRDLVNSGVSVLLVAELDVDDAWAAADDYSHGRKNAQIALDDARAAGIPDSVGIAAAADSHAANQRQIQDAVAYATGFRDVLGLSRTGFYGFSETLNAVHDAGVASWFWRCGSEPSAQEKIWVTFWQRNKAPTTRTVSGVICDINEQYNPIGEDVITDEDIRRIWTSEIIPNRVYDGKNDSASTLLGWTNAEAHTANATTAKLIDLIAASPTNPVTAEALAEALHQKLAMDLVPIIRQALVDALGEDNGAQADAIAADVLAKMGAALTPKAVA